MRGSDPRELLNIIRTKLVEQKKAKLAATSSTRQVQPQPAPQPQFQTTQPEQPPRFQPQSTNVAPNLVSLQLHRLSLGVLNCVLRLTTPRPNRHPYSKCFRTWYRCTAASWQRRRYYSIPFNLAHTLNFLEINEGRVRNIISIAYVSACLKKPPHDHDIWVQRLWEIFSVR